MHSFQERVVNVIPEIKTMLEQSVISYPNRENNLITTHPMYNEAYDTVEGNCSTRSST